MNQDEQADRIEQYENAKAELGMNVLEFINGAIKPIIAQNKARAFFCVMVSEDGHAVECISITDGHMMGLIGATEIELAALKVRLHQNMHKNEGPVPGAVDTVISPTTGTAQ